MIRLNIHISLLASSKPCDTEVDSELESKSFTCRLSLRLQARLEAACASSVPCPSCSATSTMSATLPPEMIIPTGCPPRSPCQCPWHPSPGTILDHLLAGESSRCIIEEKTLLVV